MVGARRRRNTHIASSNGKDTVSGNLQLGRRYIVDLEGSVTVTLIPLEQPPNRLQTIPGVYDRDNVPQPTSAAVLSILQIRCITIGTALSRKGDLDAATDGSELIKARSGTD